MNLSRFWRGAIAAPAAALLITGGALLTASPAVAAPGTLVVSAPTVGQVLTTRSFDLTGTGTDGAVVAVTSESATGVIQVLGNGTVTGGQFSIPVTFAGDAEVTQTLAVVQALPSAPLDADTALIPITLPAAAPTAPAGSIAITSPQNGATAASRTVTFTGTAPVGSTVTASADLPLVGELVLDSVIVDGSGAFEFVVPFGPAAASPATVTFAGSDANGVALVEVPVSVNLPDPAPAPVITAPTMTSIVGTSVTFSGTGIPGNGIAIVIVPTDEATLTALAGIDPATLAQPISVDAQGNWTATFELVLGSFTAAAVHTEDPTSTPLPQIISLPSNEVSFSLVAPPVTTPAVTGPVTPVLAETGAEQAGFAAPAGLALLAGVALLLAGRRREAAAARR